MAFPGSALSLHSMSSFSVFRRSCSNMSSRSSLAMRVASSPPVTSAGSSPGGILSSGWFRPVRQYGEYVLGGATVIGMLVTIWAALIYSPREVNGDFQRIVYVHVPVAWVAFLAFFVVFCASILFLWRKDERWDRLAWASAEVGVIFTTLTLITGSLWGKAFWGAWWVWDARLTTTLILWFIYVVYLVVRSFWGRTAQGARNAAVYGILAFFVVPINYEAVTWWRTLHPSEVLPLGGTPQLPPAMVIALLLSLG